MTFTHKNLSSPTSTFSNPGLPFSSKLSSSYLLFGFESLVPGFASYGFSPGTFGFADLNTSPGLLILAPDVLTLSNISFIF